MSKHDLSRTGGPWRQRGGFAFACLIAWLLLLPPQASAETLFEALENAYVINPTINAERARLRATDEDVARAMSGFRPTISGTAEANYLTQHGNVKGQGNDLHSDAGKVNTQPQQPLFAPPVYSNFRPSESRPTA